MQVAEKTYTFPAGAALAPNIRVKLSAGTVVAAGAEEDWIGTTESRTYAAGESVAVLLRGIGGVRSFVAAGAITSGAVVYGAASGTIDDIANASPIGTALAAASGSGSIIPVVENVTITSLPGEFPGPLVYEDDFISDYPAAATALGFGQPWLKLETNGLGVIDSDEANGVKKFVFDNAAEAATAALYIPTLPFDIDKTPVVDFYVAVFDIGDDAALDINIGLATEAHATDFDASAQYAAFHLDGNSLLLKAQSKDGTTTVAAVTTGVTLTDDTYVKLRIDCTDKADVKFYVNDARVASGTTFTMAAFTGRLTPIVHVEKTSNDTTADVRLDKVRITCDRN